MLMEKIAIARGYQRAETRRAPPLALVPSAAAVAGGCEAYRSVQDRLAALERLADLRERGVITDSELESEKGLILGQPVDAPVPDRPQARAEPARGTTLIGRIMRWQLLPLGLVTGLAFSYATQPRETLRFLDQALRLIS